MRAKDHGEIERVLLEEEVPANDFCRLRVANEDKIPVISVHDEVGNFEKVVQLRDGKTFEFLNLPPDFHVRERS
jgi:hypothetical protein